MNESFVIQNVYNYHCNMRQFNTFTNNKLIKLKRFMVKAAQYIFICKQHHLLSKLVIY